jgi:hypothetical protein
MFIWELRGIGILTIVLIALLVARLVAGRLILPPEAYIAGSLAGFSGYIAFLLASGSTTFEGGGIAAEIWEEWLWVAPLILPLVAGFVGWVATRSSLRRYFLATGVGLLLLPLVAAIALYLLGGTAKR